MFELVPPESVPAAPPMLLLSPPIVPRPLVDPVDDFPMFRFSALLVPEEPISLLDDPLVPLLPIVERSELLVPDVPDFCCS